MVAALQSPGSRRSVAPHRLCAPQPPLYSPALPRGCNRPWGRASRRPAGRLTPAPVRPKGAPFLPPGRAGRPLRGDRPAPPAYRTFPLPGPGRLRFALTAGPRAFPRTAPRPSDAPLVRTNINFELRADGRHALRGDCCGPPVFSFITRTRSDPASRGRTRSGPGMRCARQLPVTSFVGDRRPRASFFSRRGDTCVTPRLDGRRDSPSATLRSGARD